MDLRTFITAKVCPTCQALFDLDVEKCPHDQSLLAVVKRDPFVGRLLADRYDIMEKIGIGGYSTVYRAHQTNLNRDVAVKILHAQFVEEPDKIKRFQLEADAISNLVHTNVAPVFDYGMLPEGQPYLVMEYLSGKSLAQEVRDNGPISSARALDLFIQACEGLAAAHARNIIHRDIKPANLVLTAAEDGSERLKILDFGLAKVIDPAAGGEERPHLTVTGQALGTPAYMSPEQCTGEKLDVRSDIYSFGCVMYFALSGKHPIDGESDFDVMNKHLKSKPLPLAKHVKHVPAHLERIIFKAMEKEREDRFQSFRELRDALLGVDSITWKEILQIILPSKQGKALSRRARHRRLWICAALCALLFVVVGVQVRVRLWKEDHANSTAIKNKYEGQVIEFNEDPIKFQYSAIFDRSDGLVDGMQGSRLSSKIRPEQNRMELKRWVGKKVPAAKQWALDQEKLHAQYAGFLESQEVRPLKFGRGRLISGWDTIFVRPVDNYNVLERHVYFDLDGHVLKLKLKCLSADAKEMKQYFQDLLDTVESNQE